MLYLLKSLALHISIPKLGIVLYPSVFPPSFNKSPPGRGVDQCFQIPIAADELGVAHVHREDEAELAVRK